MHEQSDVDERADEVSETPITPVASALFSKLPSRGFISNWNISDTVSPPSCCWRTCFGIDHGLPGAIRLRHAQLLEAELLLEEIARKQGLRVCIPADCLFPVPVERMQ